MTTYHDDLFEVASLNDPELLMPRLPAVKFVSNIRNRDGVTLLLHCLYHGADRNIEQLVALHPNLTLHEAAALGQQDRVFDLTERDSLCINSLSGDGWTALHLAAFFGHGSVVKILLAHGADPHMLSRAFEVNIPLQAACAVGASPAAILLVSATSDVDITGPSKTSALMSAAHNGMADVVDALIEKGADPSRQNGDGKTAEDYAIEGGHQALADHLATVK